MSHHAITMGRRKKIALVAHDNKKKDERRLPDDDEYRGRLDGKVVERHRSG